MKLEVLTLCDAATADPSGKLNLLGAFDTLFAAKAPVVHPACAVAVRLRFYSPGDEGAHSFELRFADSDGRAILPAMKGEISVGSAPDLRSQSRNIVINIQQLRLPAFGEYTIDLFCDGESIGSIPLYAISVAASR